MYTTPSKADFDYDLIPARFFAGSDGAVAVSPIEYFRNLRDQGRFHFAYLDGAEVIREENPEYPVFYKTGIHWSRPAEQFVSQKLVELLQEQLGETIPQIRLGELQSSKEPYWRDSDVYDLLNVWQGKKDDTYYEYATSVVGSEDNHPRVFLIGGSFAMGLERDLVELGISELVQYLNYDYGEGYRYIRENYNDGQLEQFKHVQEQNWQEIFDQSDVLVIECNEAVLLQKSKQDAVVEYLESFLSTYTPQIPAVNRIDFSDEENWNSSVCKGVYWPEGDHAWVTTYGSIQLMNDQIQDAGLEIELYIPDELALSDKQVCISVNSKQVWEKPLSESGTHLIHIPASEICTNTHYYFVEFSAGDSFNPKELGGDDDRDLSVCLLYLGEEREEK